MTQTVDDDEHQHSKENSGKLRKLMMAELMDYGDPEANTNPKYGDLFTPPSPEVGAPSP
ncbi:uncharacterized protein G2W53_042108 [Senna tora]|uniref:Uncharacterized protein n=1 Tax=Senna tora TaxID=362788 RepID=A0A834SL22_9FABA|nr:uncharacterized protein G2W53_042108 [Senna tora]